MSKLLRMLKYSEITGPLWKNEMNSILGDGLILLASIACTKQLLDFHFQTFFLLLLRPLTFEQNQPRNNDMTATSMIVTDVGDENFAKKCIGDNFEMLVTVSLI